MQGVILAGGSGSRLDPLTRVMNKHLLPVYDRPMICYPLECLVRSGIADIAIVTGPAHVGLFRGLLGDGSEYGARRLRYGVQDRAGGIAEALGVAAALVERGPLTVMLGDNLLEFTIESHIAAFRQQRGGARILVTEVDEPQSFGIAEIDDGRLVRLVEKPVDPPGNLAVIGVYMYDEHVFERVRTLRPSARGELEITDLNRSYLDDGQLGWGRVQGWWEDAGDNFDHYLAVCNRVAAGGANHRPAAGG